MKELDQYAVDVAGCTACPLSETRTQVVFGAGDPQAPLMLIGEAPGRTEDERGRPFVGRAGKILDELLAGIGLERDAIYIANVLCCRPPGNRDPKPDEIEACSRHLFAQLKLVRPRVIATLGNFASKLLSGEGAGINTIHGVERDARFADLRVLLYPVYHPAAAIYAPSLRTVLERDFARIPELLTRDLSEPAFEPESADVQLALGISWGSREAA